MESGPKSAPGAIVSARVSAPAVLVTAVAVGILVAVDNGPVVSEGDSVGVDRGGGNRSLVAVGNAATVDVAGSCAGDGNGAVVSPPVHATANNNKSDADRTWYNMVPIYNAWESAAMR